MNYKNYIYSFRYFILVSLLIFSFSIIYGCITAQVSPEQTKAIIEEFKDVYKPILQASPFVQFLLVFLNNTLAAFLVILLSVIFGIVPVLALVSNGFIIGIFAFLWTQEFSLFAFFNGILPHGIIEIPVLIIASTIGLKIGYIVFIRVFKKQGEIKLEIINGLNFFIRILLPLILIAAFIEIFITPLFF